MTITNSLESLRRPRLLVRAARHGLSEYNRKRDLRRIAGFTENATPQRVTTMLLDMEDNMEQRRVAGDAAYEPARHIELLVALMAESKQASNARLETKSRQRPLGWRVIDGTSSQHSQKS